MEGNDERGVLTRKADVLAVLQAGGHVKQRDNLVALFDAAGRQVQAWQTAIRSAERELERG